MFDIPSELERLAQLLLVKADTAEALHKEHKTTSEKDDAAKQLKRAENARHFADICKTAASRLRVRVKMGAFMPPTLEQVFEFTKVKCPTWPREDIIKWWNHFESCGWRVGGNGGKQMRKWEQAAQNGWAYWKEKHPGAKLAAKKDGDNDPDGWREFLKGVPTKYEPFQYAAPWLKSQFAKVRKSAK